MDTRLDHGRIAAISVCVAFLALIGIAVPRSRAAAPTTIACDGTALAQAFESGGTYVFGGNCTLPLSGEFTLHTATTLTLEAGGHEVALVGTDLGSPFWAGNGNRLATVDGHLTLVGITVKQFGVGGTTLDGTPGTVGAAGTDSSCPSCPPGNGTDQAGNGGDGGHGGDGRDAHAGALLIDGTGVVTLEGSTFTEDFSTGGRGGAGGAGGDGGITEGRGTTNQPNFLPGGNAGNGGEGGDGGDAYGGAIENRGTLVVRKGFFEDDVVMGGTSVGGRGGEGGVGALAGGAGGDGGAAGRTGAAFGGAIYNTGELSIVATEFIADYAGYTGVSFSGNGGAGASQFGAEPGVLLSPGGPGGNGAQPGTIGLVAGGDVYSTGAFTVTGGHANGVTSAGFSEGGAGGRGGHGSCTYNENHVLVPPCGPDGALGAPDPQGNPPLSRGQTVGETFVPTPNAGSEGSGEGGEGESGGGSGGGDGGGSGSGGSGEAGSGGPGSGGPGSTGSGSGNSGSGSGNSGSGSGNSGSGSGNSGSGSGNSGSGSGGSGSGAGSGGNGSGGGHAVLGKVASSGTTASVPVECPASSPSCAITAELTTSGSASGGRTPAATAVRLRKSVVLGRATMTVRPGHSATLKVKLGSRGKRLLASHRRLTVRLTVLQRVGGKPGVLRSGIVRFANRG